MKNTFVNQSCHGNGETQKTLIKIKYGQKSRRTKDLVLKTDPTITSGGWKQEGLEFVSRNETLGAKQRSSHHITARITVFSEKMAFHSLNHSQLAISLWVFLTFSRLSQNQLQTGADVAADLWIWHIHECKILSFPPRLWEVQRVSAIGLEKETLIVTAGQCWWVSSQGVLNYKAIQRVSKGKGDHCRNTTTWGTGTCSKWAQGADRLIFPSLPPEDGLRVKWKEQLPRSGVIATACDLSPAARYTTPSFCKCIRENTCSDHWWQLC